MSVVDSVVVPLTVIAVVGCGLIAGVFVAFSVAVMPALARTPAAQGAAVMQAVNVVIVRPLFLLPFLGTAVACVALVVIAPGDVLHLAGAALYVLGGFGVTMVANVPLNNALAAVDPTDPDGARVWERYRRRWTAWNHVRAVAATGAAAALAVAPWV